MARSRSNGTGFAVALVVMGFLFFIAVIFAVIFFVQLNTAKVEATQAKADLRKYVTPDEQRNAIVSALEAEATGPDGQTVVASFLGETRYLKENIFGDPSVELGNFRERKDMLTQQKGELHLQYALLK